MGTRAAIRARTAFQFSSAWLLLTLLLIGQRLLDLFRLFDLVLTVCIDVLDVVDCGKQDSRTTLQATRDPLEETDAPVPQCQDNASRTSWTQNGGHARQGM